MKSTPILSIVGKSKSGKTTLLEKIIGELKKRGYRIATVKHHSHPGFEMDIPGKDTWRHARAGSDHVILAAPDRIASIRSLERELDLDEIIPQIQGVDIIFTEGFKRAGKPAIEVIRKEKGLDFVGQSDHVIAFAADTSLVTSVPQFDLNDAIALADWIEANFLKT